MAHVPGGNVGGGENDYYGLDVSGASAGPVGRMTDRSTDLTSPLAETLQNGS